MKFKYLFRSFLSVFLVTFLGCASSGISDRVSETRNINHSHAGLQDRSVAVDGHTIHYVEGGAKNGESILLIHGFGADSDNWLYFIGFLTDKFHVVALDLPGFGLSSRIDGESYSIASQVKRVHSFTEKAGLRKFHIAGNSMGGAIAGIYAAEYPSDVLSLALLAPSGIRNGIAKAFSSDLKKGRNPLLMLSDSDFERMLGLCFHNKPPVPDFIKTHLIDISVKYEDFNRKIFDDIINDYSLERKMKDISVKTLVIWGENDGILDVSGAAVLKKGIKASKTLMIKECGHTPMLEKPGDTAAGYLDFIRTDHPDGHGR